jgi:hypothetical protein
VAGTGSGAYFGNAGNAGGATNFTNVGTVNGGGGGNGARFGTPGNTGSAGTATSCFFTYPNSSFGFGQLLELVENLVLILQTGQVSGIQVSLELYLYLITLELKNDLFYFY